MGATEEIFKILTSGGIVLALYIAAQGMLLDRDQVYHRVLALVALCAGGYSIYFYLSKIGVLNDGGWYCYLFPAPIFAIAPAIYVLFRLPLDSGADRLSHYFVHFVPALIALFLPPIFYVTGIDAMDRHPIFYLRSDQSQIYPMDWLFYSALGHNVLYYMAVLFNMKNLFALARNWRRGVLSSAYVMIAIVATVLGVVIIGALLKSSPVTSIGGPLTTVALFIAALFLRSNPEVFSHFEDAVRQSAYKNSGMDDGDIIRLKKKLQSLIETDKVYADEKLTARQLAESLEIGTHHLSELLNVHMKTNFSTLINSYRVHDALELLTSQDVDSVNVAYRVGFNSKATFHRAFRKVMGCSPREFQAAPSEHHAVALNWFNRKT